MEADAGDDYTHLAVRLCCCLFVMSTISQGQAVYPFLVMSKFSAIYLSQIRNL
jgi:hypothetical protein